MNDRQSVLFLCTGNFYRSRYAEAWFNFHAPRRGLLWQAESRGFRPHLEEEPLSPHATRRLVESAIPRTHTRHAPERLVDADLAGASLVVAVYEREHRPMMESAFPGWSGRIRYWDVPDIDEAPPESALGRIEVLVDALVEQLGAGHALGARSGVRVEF